MYVGGFGAFPRATNTFPSNMMDGPQAFWGLELDARLRAGAPHPPVTLSLPRHSRINPCRLHYLSTSLH